jgi:hypothetical protein
VPLGLEEDLMALRVRELDDLVFDRRAVAWAAGRDRPAVHRALPDVVGDDLLADGAEMSDPAGELRQGALRLTARGDPAEVAPAVVELRELAVLPLQPAEVDRAAIDPRRGAGLEATHREPRALQLLGEMSGRRLARPPAGDAGGGADVDAAAQERAGGDDHAARAEAAPLERLDAGTRAPPSQERRATVPWIVASAGAPRAASGRRAVEPRGRTARAAPTPPAPCSG